MLVYLLRHGQTVYNQQRRYQGQLDIPLSDEGRKALKPADFTPDMIYVSPLKRAVETAEILFPGSKQCAISDFQEMNFGVFEGRSFREMADDPDYRAWVDSGCLEACPGGERRQEFSDRVTRAFAQLMESRQSHLVVVAHGGTQMAILEKYGRPRRNFYQWKSGNGQGFLLKAHNWSHKQELELLQEISYIG